jgi:DNA-binding CsgD family transcriptional regulator
MIYYGVKQSQSGCEIHHPMSISVNPDELSGKQESLFLDYLENLNIDLYNEHIPDLVNGLKNCLVLPSQMLWLTHYKPMEYVFKKNIEKVLGYSAEEFSPTLYLKITHPEDKSFVFHHIRYSIEYYKRIEGNLLNVIFTIEHRLRHKEGHYKKIQRFLYPRKLDKEANLVTCLNLINDITHIKTDNRPKVVLFNLKTNVKYHFAIKDHNFEVGLSQREIEILQELAEGKTSDMIADTLHISKHTVDVHRRKMLEKIRLGNTAELITYGYRSGIIE